MSNNMHLITGHAGAPHVTASDVAAFLSALFGTGSYVLDRGKRFAATVVSNNKVSIADGDILFQGRHARIDPGAAVDLVIENGSSGMNRCDLIVARYERQPSTGVESINLIVLKGTAVSGVPSDPAYEDNSILDDNALTADFPLYRIPLSGLNVGTPVALFNTQKNIEQQILDAFKNAAPAKHASSDPVHGTGSSSEYGHVKLSDRASDHDTDNGIAATPKAVQEAIELANAAKEKADTSMSKDGGLFTGIVTMHNSNYAGGCGRNILVQNNDGTANMPTQYIIMQRK